MGRSVRVGSREVSGAAPAICVPVASPMRAEVLAQAQAAAAHPGVDIIEWRVDYDPTYADADAMVALGNDVRRAIGGTALLATVRTTGEDGRADLDAAKYCALLGSLCAAPIDALDVELTSGQRAATLMRRAAARGITTVVSLHDWEGTMSGDDLADALVRMEQSGADIVKIAAMVPDAASAMEFLGVVADYVARPQAKPLIAAPMGPSGAVARLMAIELGAAGTFAALSEVTAPGQMNVGVVASVLQAMGRR